MPDPTPELGQVRVRIHVSGLNPSDTKARGGFGGNTHMDFPRIIPGQDGSGIIDRVGPEFPNPGWANAYGSMRLIEDVPSARLRNTP